MLLVVVADAGDHTKGRRADVGAIESPAQADFNNIDIGIRLAEQDPAEGGGEFEEGWLAVFALAAFCFGLADLIYAADEERWRDGGAVDHEPFFEVDEVRGGEQAGFQAASPEGFCQKPADRSFSFGTRHVQDGGCELGIPQLFEQIGHTSEFKFARMVGAIDRFFIIDTVEEES